MEHWEHCHSVRVVRSCCRVLAILLLGNLYSNGRQHAAQFQRLYGHVSVRSSRPYRMGNEWHLRFGKLGVGVWSNGGDSDQMRKIIAILVMCGSCFAQSGILVSS